MPLYLTAIHTLNLLNNTWQRKFNFQIHVDDAVTFKFNQDASEFYHMKPLASYAMGWQPWHVQRSRLGSTSRWSYHRRFRSLLLSPLSVECYYLPLLGDWWRVGVWMELNKSFCKTSREQYCDTFCLSVYILEVDPWPSPWPQFNVKMGKVMLFLHMLLS